MTATGKQTRATLRPPSSGVRRAAPTSAQKRNAFPKSARLLKHPDFQHVYETGRKQFSASMIFFFILREGAGEVQVGITVGRVLGGAVDRNRIKRRMRDVIRHQHAALKSALSARGISAEIVINPKKSVLTADIAALRAEVERGFGIIAAANISQKPGDARTK
jgi:ribonuclease P protein component